MQINIDDSAALLLLAGGAVGGVLLFAPDMAASVLNDLGAALQGVTG